LGYIGMQRNHDIVTVNGRITPFQADADVWQMPEGVSVSAMLERIMPKAAVTRARVFVNDRLLPQDEYASTFPKAGDIVVFRVIPAGGDGKDVVRIVGLIAVVAFASWAGHAASSLFWDAGLSSVMGLGTFQSVVSGLAFFAGALALNALIPPPTPKLPQISSPEQASATYSIEGFQNQIRPWGVIPRVFGRHRMAPYYAAKPYTELVGNDQYIRALFCWGYGPLHITDMRLGDTPLHNFTGVEIDHRSGLPGDTKIGLFPTQVKEENLSIRIREGVSEGWADYDLGVSLSWIYDMQPVSATVLLIATAGGLLRYDSAAASGEQVTAVLEDALANPRHVTKAPDGNLYAWTPRIGSGRLFCSTDDGVTWVQCGSDVPCYNVAVAPPGFVSHGPDLFLFLVESVGGVTSLAIYSVAATGLTRVATVTSGFSIFSTSSISAGSNGTVLWVTVDGNLFKSTDAGVTWAVATSVYDKSLYAVYSDVGVTLVGTTGGSVLRSVDNGSTWTEVALPLGATTVAALYKSAAGIIYAGDWLGKVFSSADDGLSWTLHGEPGDNQIVRVIDEFNSELILAIGMVDVWRIMRHATVANVRTTAAETDEIVAIVSFQGLGKFQSNGAIGDVSVDFVVEYAPTGTTNWSIGDTGVTVASTTLTPDDNLRATVHRDPEFGNSEIWRGVRIDLVVLDRSSGEFRIRTGVSGTTRASVTGIRAEFARSGRVTVSISTGVWYRRSDTLTAPEPGDNEMAIAAVLLIADVTLTKTLNSDGWYTHSWASTVLNIEAGDVYDLRDPEQLLASGDFAASADGLSRTVTVAGGTVTSIYTVTAATSSAVRYAARMKVPRGQYDVRVRRLTPDSISDTVMDKMYWTGLQSITYDDPVNMDGLCLTAIRIKATEQLAGTIDNLNGIAHSILPDWDPDSGKWVERITSNPASHLRHILTNAKENRLALKASDVYGENIDLYEEDFRALHEHCQKHGIECNLVVDYDISVRDLFARIAAVARATETLRGGYLTGVLIDKEQAIERQVISPRNAWGFRWRRDFADQLHALRVRFVNEDKNWTQDEIVVYADGYDSASATRYDSLELLGITNHRQAYREARYHMAVAKLRPESWTVTMDFESLAVTRGSLVRFAYDVPKIGASAARIKQVVDDGVNITALVLDEKVVMETGKSYCLRVRHDDMSLSYHPLVTSAGVSDTVTLLTPVALSTGPQTGDLCLFGEVGTESVQALVKSVEPGDDLTAVLTLVPYSPQVYLADKVVAIDVTTGVLPDTDTIMLANHGFANGDPVQLGTTDTMPGGLTDGAVYYVINAVADSFQLATAAGGPAVDITTTGAGYLYVAYTIPEYSPVVADEPGADTPVVESIVSDETVMIRRPDGTLSPRIQVVLANVAARDLEQIEAIVVRARRIPEPTTGGGRVAQ